MIAQALGLMVSVQRLRRVPDDWLQTLGEQLAFVAALRELGSLDLLPLGMPDGRPDLAAGLPLVYEGISQGAIHGQGLLAYASEIRGFSLVAGGGRLADLLLHQAGDGLVDAMPLVFGGHRPIDLWTTLSLFQLAFDRQDTHLHAALARTRASGRTPEASVLLTAGRGDSFVPNRASRSLAWVLGPLPWLEISGPSAVGLPMARLPLRANQPDGSTGAYIEFVPSGSDRPPTPGCDQPGVSIAIMREGHFCAQLAPESLRQRVTFLRSAAREDVRGRDRPVHPGSIRGGHRG